MDRKSAYIEKSGTYVKLSALRKYIGAASVQILQWYDPAP
jgi:hypothetical protein